MSNETAAAVEMSITRALAEIKLLEKRINQGVEEFNAATVVAGHSVPPGYESVAAFQAASENKAKSLAALIDRRNRIKAGVIASNAITMVTIDGTKMTVAEAIERKSSIGLTKSLHHTMQSQLSAANRKAEMGNAKILDEANARAIAALGDNAKKDAATEYESLINKYVERNKYVAVAPRDMTNVVEKMGASIDQFEAEVDYVLSESNTVTKIRV